MLSAGNSDLIKAIERTSVNGQYMELLVLIDDRVIALSSSAMALYRDLASINDALGNGLTHIRDIPTAYTLAVESAPWTSHHAAGFVGFHNGMALLILPNDIKLYSSKDDALRNSNPVLTLPLSQ